MEQRFPGPRGVGETVPHLLLLLQLHKGDERRVFDHRVCGKDAAKRLLSVRQGSHSVVEMAIEFCTLATESGWNEKALPGAFRNTLTETLKDELVSRDEPDGLDELSLSTSKTVSVSVGWRG